MAIYSRQIFPTSNHKLQFQYTSFSKVNIGNVILGENIGNESQSYELFVASDFHFQMSNSERASLVVYDEFGSIVGTVQFSLLDVLHDEIDWFTGDVGPWSDYFSFDYSDLYLTAFDDSSGLRFFVIESASSSQNGCEHRAGWLQVLCNAGITVGDPSCPHLDWWTISPRTASDGCIIMYSKQLTVWSQMQFSVASKIEIYTIGILLNIILLGLIFDPRMETFHN
ncbi:uncharacterized protein LOC142340110 [Convolutriloba macropyga]|uniref:uncharacterized protein LOC142340110 n=1 Tax=Convolutriloba macropyga TaxID=536237 RepID=UPI003F51C838